ncbi:hypothetical protein Fot_15338 [Forsythia ovata]|uniref:Uncharacterized protein n=1 Tax=Forsythia ovata TaxID=205694 RepID=A0ABD1W8V6_9LAMI
MRMRSKRHRRNSSVKLVEIVELSDGESDVENDDDKVKGVEEGAKVEGDAMGTEGDKVKGVAGGEFGYCEIGNECDTVGIEGEIVGVEYEMENDGQAAGIKGEMGVGIQTKGAYVPQFTKHKNCNIELEWEAFFDRHQDDIWNI